MEVVGMKKILAVIPARGGSKGIPRKNVRFMNGKPLIAYAITNAVQCTKITDCVVTTDDDEIADVARKYGSDVVFRNEELSGDAVTLDPVVYDALQKMEKIKKCKYDIVITLQPTSPLLTQTTLQGALNKFETSKVDSIISVVNAPHLSWTKKQGKVVPNYTKRLNRQQLPPNYLETGAFLITKCAFVKAGSRLGKKIDVFEVPVKEAIDIDSVEDWLMTESLLKKKNIIFRVDGMKLLGLGHIYNCITMAFNMMEHNVLFVTRQDCKEGIAKLRSTNLPFVTIKSEKDIDDIIAKFKPDIWVNDCLNTSANYIKKLKKQIKRVVTIEDLGTGVQYADATINALYEQRQVVKDNIYFGPKYVCLRNEFQLAQPKVFADQVKHVVVMFGGTDPSNLNKKLYKVASKIVALYPWIHFHFITGIGYDADSNGVVSIPGKNIEVLKNVPNVTKYMSQADLAVTSQGRTVYEIASLGIPAIVLSQNEREMTHTFASMKNGFINLGLGKNIKIDAIVNTLKWLIETPNIRSNMRDLMLRHDFHKGIGRVKSIIVGDEDD